jgi:DNA gyrase/topoisomerase IV subunit B
LGKQGYRRNFDVSECLVSKVIFLCDADIDGAHISALLLRLFVMYFPQMIKAGMIYKAVPPLFSVKQGSKRSYFVDNVDMIKYIQKAFREKYVMADLKGRVVESREMTTFFIRNADYTYYLERVANTYAVDPYLLELILIHYCINKGFKYDKLKKEIESKYRFMYVEKKNNSILVSGTIAESNMVILDDRLIKDCRFILNIMNENTDFYYKISNEKHSIYSVMKLYEQTTPSNVQRYKGLGEMDKHQLAESVLYPGSNRVLIRYTLEDAKEEIEAIREYESNSKKILDLVGNVTRLDLAE